MDNTVKSYKKRLYDHSHDVSSEFALTDCYHDDFVTAEPLSKKPCWDQQEELIQLIIKKRNNLSCIDNQIVQDKKKHEEKKLSSVSRNIPFWNFITVSNTKGERFYLKLSNKNYNSTKFQKISKLLLKSIEQIKDEAEQIMIKNSEKADQIFRKHSIMIIKNQELWIDKYRPSRYIDLLSDEKVNRVLLHWLKLWDKIVFNQESHLKVKKNKSLINSKRTIKQNDKIIPDYDSNSFPTQRLALLTGSPGLGKTTLAHIAAKHAGYNVVEINASDDRGPEAFREALLSSTQMSSMIDQSKRPNCLILDEIDGASNISIELLVKFINGTLFLKKKHSKNQCNRNNSICKRPIICICNDLYTTSLRPLRKISLIINVPEISPSSLVQRLFEITRQENLLVSSSVLEQLAEKSACDIRACLGFLQYTGEKSDLLRNIILNLKNVKKGLFDSWKDLLRIPITRKGPLSDVERADQVSRITHQVEAERLMQGIFHNYPDTCKKSFSTIIESLHWFEFYDEINTFMLQHQTWTLTPYMITAFISFHLHLASSKISNILYPTPFFEINKKRDVNNIILTGLKKTSRYDISTLITEVLPYLPDLLTPRLRSLNVRLYSAKEKSELERIIIFMLDFGLSLVQEKNLDGGYDYIFEPDFWKIGVFPECKSRNQFPNAIKQVVIQELETKKLQHADNTDKNLAVSNFPSCFLKNQEKSDVNPIKQKDVPNYMTKLDSSQPETVSKKRCWDFFVNIESKSKNKFNQLKVNNKDAGGDYNSKINIQLDIEKKRVFFCDTWYQYIEGYSNAVRRNISLENLK